MREARAPHAAIAGKLQIMPFKVSDMLEASRAWSDEDLKAAFVALDRADRLIKNSGDARAALSVAVVEACGRTDPRIRPGARPAR